MQARSQILSIVAAGRSDAGSKRSHNEDAILVRSDLNLFAVADGAGGLMPSPQTQADSRFSVLPSGSASDSLIDSKGHLVARLKTLVSRTSPDIEVSAVCPECSESIARAALFCPHCGGKQPP